MNIVSPNILKFKLVMFVLAYVVVRVLLIDMFVNKMFSNKLFGCIGSVRISRVVVRALPMQAIWHYIDVCGGIVTY